MAWGSIGDAGSGNNKISASVIAFIPIITIDVGTVLVIVVAKDNVQTTDGETNEITSADDDSGGTNVYTKVAEFTIGQGAAAAGATVAVFFCLVTTQLTTANTVAAHFSAAVTAKSITAWNFSIGAGAVVSRQVYTTLANSAADPGSMDLTPPNAEFLWVRAIALEGVVGTFTKTVAYTAAYTLSGTTGGGATTNMSAGGEWRIFTGTTNPSDPTWQAADNASILCALVALVPPATHIPRRPFPYKPGGGSRR